MANGSVTLNSGWSPWFRLNVSIKYAASKLDHVQLARPHPLWHFLQPRRQRRWRSLRKRLRWMTAPWCYCCSCHWWRWQWCGTLAKGLNPAVKCSLCTFFPRLMELSSRLWFDTQSTRAGLLETMASASGRNRRCQFDLLFLLTTIRLERRGWKSF